MKTYQDTENKIIGNLLRTPLESKSLHQLSIDTGLTYVTVHKVAPNLIQRKLLKSFKKGKATLVSIDFDNAKIHDLSSASLYERNIFFRKYPEIAILARETQEIFAGQFYILILFGSYAKEKPTEKSDLDLLFIIPNPKDREIYLDKIKKALRLHTTIKKDFNVVSTEDYAEMLNQKYSVGREAFQHGIVLFGAEHYYSMVKKYVREKGY